MTPMALGRARELNAPPRVLQRWTGPSSVKSSRDGEQVCLADQASRQVGDLC